MREGPIKLNWSKPRRYPRGSAVYAILLDKERAKERFRVIKIGATRDIYGRISGYWKAFKIDPRLRLIRYYVPEHLKKSVQRLYRKNYPGIGEKDWKHLEYIVEAFLISEYRRIWKKRPPANHDSGSYKKYERFFRQISIKEKGALKVLKLRPATRGMMSEEVLHCLDKRKAKGSIN